MRTLFCGHKNAQNNKRIKMKENEKSCNFLATIKCLFVCCEIRIFWDFCFCVLEKSHAVQNESIFDWTNHDQMNFWSKIIKIDSYMFRRIRKQTSTRRKKEKLMEKENKWANKWLEVNEMHKNHVMAMYWMGNFEIIRLICYRQ